ncbi:hypothetical protein GF361_01720 [Candidatus Woesearchaeota archaeon]|nr:hypothetical protein [Candidatus Woesearchaeota archaeon]
MEANMMKKIMILMAVFLLAVPAVFSGCPCNEESTVDKITAAAAAAINSTQDEINNEIESRREEIRERIQDRNLTREEIRSRVQEIVQSENFTMLRERIHTGLENALTRVNNENARQRLQTNLERFQQRYEERLQKMENVSIEDVDNETGAVRLRARRRVRFLGFIRGKVTKRFDIDENGNIEERAPWYRFLYTESDEEETEVNETE